MMQKVWHSSLLQPRNNRCRFAAYLNPTTLDIRKGMEAEFPGSSNATFNQQTYGINQQKRH